MSNLPRLDAETVQRLMDEWRVESQRALDRRAALLNTSDILPRSVRSPVTRNYQPVSLSLGDCMNAKQFLTNFETIAEMQAPLIIAALGLPAQVAQSVTDGIAAAKQLAGADNNTKALKAAQVAQDSIAAINSIRTQHGLPTLIDPTASTDALNIAIKMTYDISKMISTAAQASTPDTGGAPTQNQTINPTN